jgi:hypothetical protein
MSTIEKIDGLLIEAKHFLQAGGVITKPEWAKMTEAERDAHAEAGRELRLESAVLAGLASVKLEPNLNGGSGAIAGIVRSLVETARRMEQEAK